LSFSVVNLKFLYYFWRKTGQNERYKQGKEKGRNGNRKEECKE
jgi:hypothetical protein